MATAAHGRLSPSASLVIAEGRDLPFRDASFGLVLDRHAQVSLAEFARVLVPGGMLIIQQLGGHNLQSLFDAFGWGQTPTSGANSGRVPSALRPSCQRPPDWGSTL
jgi:ubiquinone/menaquinone biosynthesis C-methylase UbiE